MKVSANEKCSDKFKIVLNMLNIQWIEEKDCDSLMQQYNLFLENIPVFGPKWFVEFACKNSQWMNFSLSVCLAAVTGRENLLRLLKLC